MNTGAVFRIAIEDSGIPFAAPAGQSILEAAEQAGLALPHDCRGGGCGSCRIRLIAGQVTYDEPPMALTEAEATAGYALACRARPQSDLIIALEPAPVAPEPQRARARIAELAEIAPDILHLDVVLAAGAAPAFLAGQHMNVLLDDGVARSVSMASAPDAGRLDFYIRRIAGGAFTDRALSRLRPGDWLDVELPLGSFCYRARDDRPLLMAATGTGIAPIKSILDSLMDDAFVPPVTLYWGMRSENALFLDPHVQRWTERLAEFDYRPVLSAPAPDWPGRRGHVQNAILADLPDLSDYAIYLCGSPRMIAEAKPVFLAQGASPAHLYAEGFTFQHADEPAPVPS